VAWENSTADCAGWRKGKRHTWRRTVSHRGTGDPELKTKHNKEYPSQMRWRRAGRVGSKRGEKRTRTSGNFLRRRKATPVDHKRGEGTAEKKARLAFSLRRSTKRDSSRDTVGAPAARRKSIRGKEKIHQRKKRSKQAQTEERRAGRDGRRVVEWASILHSKPKKENAGASKGIHQRQRGK